MGPGAGPVGEQFAFQISFQKQLWKQMTPPVASSIILCKHLLDRQNIGVRFVSTEPPL